jgi:hypothetical protein
MIWGVGVPATVLLLWQYYHRYIFDVFGVSMSIIIAPLVIMSSLSAHEGLSTWTLLPKFFLSILFPLAVYLGYYKNARTYTQLNLAWVLFGIGAFLSYTLAEYEQATHQFYLAGDVLWCAQITLLILFVVSARFFLEQIGSPITPILFWQHGDWRLNLCRVVFALHLASGVIWFVVATLNNQDAKWF